MKIRLVSVELFYTARKTDRRIDMTKLIVDFRNFANELKNTKLSLISDMCKRNKSDVVNLIT